MNSTNRQKRILQLFPESGTIQTAELLENLEDELSRATLIRELNSLEKVELIESHGAGRGVTYKLSKKFRLIQPINLQEYFKSEEDKRTIEENFNFDLFSIDWSIFSPGELSKLNVSTETYRQNKAKISTVIRQKEFERLTIELSWKSSKIEGNTYSLLETERLLKEAKETKGKPHNDAVMLLNHKDTINYVWENGSEYRVLDIVKIEDIHKKLTQDLGITNNLRKTTVGITGTRYTPLDNQFQIREAMEKMIDLVNGLKYPYSKALATILLISYIQPFEDGNKRTGRILGNAILHAYDCCSLSYRSVDEILYKQATLLFYEQNSLSAFKAIFLEQYKFAVDNYFRT